METLEQKVVLITGTGGGMGRVASLIFAREGAKVVGCDIQVDANEETVELVRRAGGEMTGIAPIDLTDPQQAQRLVEGAVAAYGGLDVVYNNAASLRFGSMPDFSVDDWRATVVEANSTYPSSCRSSHGRTWPGAVAASSSTSRPWPA